MSRIRSSWIFREGRFEPKGELVWEGETISDVRSGVETIDSECPEQHGLLIPGLVNLHAHLELSALAHKLPQRVAFPRWVESLRRETLAWNDGDYLASWQRGAETLVASGTHTVLDIGNSHANWCANPPKGLRVIAMRELLSLDSNIALHRFEKACAELGNYTDSPRHFRGLSVHAPYSTHPDLFALVQGKAQSDSFPLTFHLAESREEQLLYAESRGAFREWLDALAPQHPFHNPTGSPWLRCQEMGVGARAIVVHGNTLSAQEMSEMAKAKVTLVHCPQSAAWFGHPELDVKMCQQAGLPVCLGTDSLASAESLSLWDQVAVFHKRVPHISAAELLRMVTEIPGEAIRQTCLCGSLLPGFSADWLLLEIPPDASPGDWSWLGQGTPTILSQSFHSSP